MKGIVLESAIGWNHHSMAGLTSVLSTTISFPAFCASCISLRVAEFTEALPHAFWQVLSFVCNTKLAIRYKQNTERLSMLPLQVYGTKLQSCLNPSNSPIQWANFLSHDISKNLGHRNFAALAWTRLHGKEWPGVVMHLYSSLSRLRKSCLPCNWCKAVQAEGDLYLRVVTGIELLQVLASRPAWVANQLCHQQSWSQNQGDLCRNSCIFKGKGKLWSDYR